MQNFENINYICGIDTLYYFCETSLDYDDLFLDILDQMEDIKGKFEKKEIEYVNADIHINIKSMTLDHLGKSEGYFWFKDINDYFKIGFKDPHSNRGLHDIRVQILANGIYTIGIKSIVELIDAMLDQYITKEHPITRIDLNCFIQYDFGFVNKSMFVARKRNYSSISEIGDAHKTQTLYVGKPPFKLRLYNKSVELKNSKKSDLMHEYFRLHGLDIKEPIFNIEFEMHRKHLKSYEILTIEEAFKSASMLFKQAMDDIRLIDCLSISEKDIEHNTKNRATTLPIWEFIKEKYTLESFLQVKSPLERIKRKAYVYDDESFNKDLKALLRKGLIHSIFLTKELLIQNLDETIQELNKPNNPVLKHFDAPKDFIPLEFDDGYKKEKFHLLKNGKLIKPVNVLSVWKMSDTDLLEYIAEIISEFSKEEEIASEARKKYKIAYDEAVNRKLKPYIPF